MSYRKLLQRLEDYPIWKHAEQLNMDIMEACDLLSDQDKIRFEWALNVRMFRVTTNIAEACGSLFPKTKNVSLSEARRSLFAVRSIYKTLHMHRVIELDPNIMVKIDGLVAEIDTEVENAWNEIDTQEKKEYTK